MPLADLLQTLEREAAARADARVAEAQADAARILAAHAAELEARRMAVLASREQALRADGERSIIAARRDAERTRLLARHELLTRVRDRARAALAMQAGSDCGHRAISALGLRARTYLGDPAGARTITQPTGVRLVDADGTVEVDATLESVLERLWPALAMDIVRRAELPA